jgi:hypothetical protein
MALYVYITEECKEDAKKHSRYQEMMALKEKVETAQRICHFDNFPTPYLKKRFDRQIRLLADHRPIKVGDDTHLVINFLRVFVRSGAEYKRFLNDTEAYGEKFLEPLVSRETLIEFLQEELREHPVPPKEPPSEAESHFLYRLLGKDQARSADDFVCESQRWVRSMEEKRAQFMFFDLCEALLNIVGNDTESTSRKVRDCEIIYRWIPSLRKLFVAGLARNQAEKEELEQLYSTIILENADSVTEESVLRQSIRTYPAFLLADQQGWTDIQQDVESNLALSPEETRVLESVHSNEGGFPIFINGRAGSGKSTILYYLFADYVNLYLELSEMDDAIRPPLLLSCSDELKVRANDVVGNLIRCNPLWKRDGEVEVEVPSQCFHEFRSFLRDLLGVEEREELFAQSKYVGYAQFRKMWDKQFGRDRKMKMLGADLSWHVIRTYIKGTNPEDFLEPEEYEHVPRRQRSVSPDAFATVHENVWEKWYKDLCEQDGYWDDQDLARYIFEKNLIEPSYSAVFCDEAQDFTRVELDLLFRLCLFADRSLRHTDICRVPFAFAGDPFQTLNPTGFRWDSIQALFHDKLVDILGENLHHNVELNFQELELNYRSTKNIVRLSNLVQAIRAALFELPNIHPQRAWQIEESSPMPVWLDRNKLTDWEQLRQESDITVLVPCMLDEEQEFVKNDPFLCQVVRTDELGFPVNVLSPTRSKGLEFGRVVLYGFSDLLKEDLTRLLEAPGYDKDQMLPLEYFVNQLYVAVSRPKRRLFIIESQEGRDKLWKIANDESLQGKLWKRITNGKTIWADYIGGFSVGSSESWHEERGNFEESAERYMQLGMSAKDPFLLRSAAVSFENLGKNAKAFLCKAYALRLEDKPKEAGDMFVKAGESNLALSSFWEAGLSAKDNIQNLHASSPDIGFSIEFRMFSAYHSPTTHSLLSIMGSLSQQASDDSLFRNRLVTEKTFADLVRAYSREIYVRDSTHDEIVQFLQFLQILADKGLSIEGDRMAELFFKVEQYKSAVLLWEKNENCGSIPNYRKAKAMILAYSYEEMPDAPISDLESRILGEYFCQNGKFLLSAKCLRKCGAIEQFTKMLSDMPDSYPDWQEVLIEFTMTLASRGEWSQLIEIATLENSGRRKEFGKSFYRVVRNQAFELRNAIVVACALNISHAPGNTKLLKQYADYFGKALSTPVQWRGEITVRAAGAALEFSGRQVDILRFYEGIVQDPLLSKEREFAWKRWIVTKEKQAAREADHGNERMAKRFFSEAADKRREFGWLDSKLKELPIVSMDMIWAQSAAPMKARGENDYQISSYSESRSSVPVVTGNVAEVSAADTSKSTAPIEAVSNQADHVSAGQECPSFVIGDFGFEFSREYGRVNISHVKTREVVNIRSSTRSMQSFDVEIREDSGIFNCEPWGATCAFSEVGRELVASFELPQLHIGLSFSFRNEAKTSAPAI